MIMKYSFTLTKTISTLLIIILLLSIPSTALASAGMKVDGKAASNEEIGKLVPYMRISEDGFFVLDQESIPPSLNVSQKTIKWVQNEFSGINTHLKEIPPSERPRVTDTGEVQLQGLLPNSGAVSEQTLLSCVYVPHWVLDAIGWTGIIYGAGLVTIGLFAYGTIYGVPIGAILQAMGLWDGVSGYFLLWVADTYYPNGMYVCW